MFAHRSVVPRPVPPEVPEIAVEVKGASEMVDDPSIPRSLLTTVFDSTTQPFAPGITWTPAASPVGLPLEEHELSRAMAATPLSWMPSP